MPLGGAQKRSSFDHPTLLEESRTRPEPERRREADEGERPVRGMCGRLSRRSGRASARGSDTGAPTAPARAQAPPRSRAGKTPPSPRTAASLRPSPRPPTGAGARDARPRTAGHESMERHPSRPDRPRRHRSHEVGAGAAGRTFNPPLDGEGRRAQRAGVGCALAPTPTPSRRGGGASFRRYDWAKALSCGQALLAP